DPVVTALKASARFAEAVEPAVGLYEEPPTTALEISTPWADVRLTTQEWADAFGAADPGTPHNEARDQVWDELVEILVDKHAEFDAPEGALRRALTRDEDLSRAFARAWPLLDARVVLADLWSVPAYLRRCAPWLSPDDVQRLQRDEPRAWTDADLPLLDALRQRIGDPEASSRRRRNEALAAEEREQRDRVVDELIAADDSELMLMSILRGEDARNSLADDAGFVGDPEMLAGPFAHVIVDEAQELTDAQWQMLIRRCPSRSFTIVGDRAQARHGFPESWSERLDRVGFRHVTLATLDVNYRTPAEIMAVAEPVIRVALPDANVPTSIRESGIPVMYGRRAELDGILTAWRAANPEGTACVIGDPAHPETGRIRSLTPELAKGLEFDLVVLVEPERFGTGIEGAVDRYVAMTRATRELVVLTA
ncbi:MAG: AAA family ATPase, partial [Microbacterium sp.]